MIVGFIIWSICAAIFGGIGISCRKSREAAGFFTFMKPLVVEDVEHYNYALSKLWFVGVGVFEIIGVPLLFLKQNSPLFVPIVLAVVVLLLVMMIVYIKIDTKYKKQVEK